MLRRLACIVSALLFAVPLLADKALIVSETGNASSREAVAALALLPSGSTVDVLSASAVSALAASSGGLSAYRVVILADNNCGGSGSLPVINGSWGTTITGNVVIIGTDQALHASQGGQQLIDKAMAYVLSKPQTGAFISLSCYYHGVAGGTPVPLLNDAFASSAGSFSVFGPGCFNDAHITATHPALTGLTDAHLANWSCSVHEAFDSWPADFVVLAIAKNAGSSYTAPDGTVGSPYILARGDVSPISDITLTPAVATNEIGKTHTVTATIAPPLPGVTITFKVVTGPNVGLTGTGLTNALGQATFTYTSTTVGSDFIVAQYSTPTGIHTSNTVRKNWVHTPEACMRILQSEVRCEVDATGHPTGNYIWTFRVQNLSGTPVSHAFISGLPAGVTATPDHLIFSPPLLGISNPQQVVIHGAPPGPLTLTVSLHDASFRQCCAAEVTLDLPKCDCAQLVGERRPSCFPSLPPPYKYAFTIQNLSPMTAQNVLVAAVSPSDLVTPVPTSQLQVTAAVNPIPATGTGGTAGPLTLMIGGPLAVGGQKVCLALSLTDKEIDDCCAITRCFTLPDCFYEPVDWDSVGGADVTPFETGFRITGIGSTGEDGVRIATGEADRAGLRWQPLDAAAQNGAFVELRASTGNGTPGGKLRVTKSAAGYELATSIDTAQRYRVEVYRGDTLAGTATQEPGIADVIVIWPVAITAEVAHVGDDENHGETLGFTVDAGREVAWKIGDTALTGDRFRIVSEQAIVHDGLHIESIELRAANLREIVVTGVAVSVDCNDNGVADAEDIANGTSFDQNGNGIPDECDGSANAVVLNTGYDDETRETLPGGSDDDDWHIVAPAPDRPAKVITQTFDGWPAALPASRWISSNANYGVSTPGVSSTTFERCFCLAGDADHVALDFALRADDRATVTLNGQQLGAGAEFFAATPLSIHRTGAVGDGLFVTGTNCLRVEVIDDGGILTGLTLEGTMTATGAACAPPHHDD